MLLFEADINDNQRVSILLASIKSATETFDAIAADVLQEIEYIRIISVLHQCQ